MRLDAIALQAGVRLEALASIGSTNKEALLRARRGEHGQLWITAEEQTEGRGRRDRTWISPVGNLYASLLLSEPSTFEHAPELAFVAVCALRDAIIAAAPVLAAELAFKWPNDLLLAGEKCAGILIEGEVGVERELEPGRRLTVVIGIGVNCASHPPSAPESGGDHPRPFSPLPARDEAVAFPATDLSAHGAAITPAQLFQRLSATMCRRLAQWDGGRSFSSILGDWLTSARGIGEEITVRDGGAAKHGRFVGLDQSGRLMLERRGGAIEKISAGDVFPFNVGGGRRVPG